MRPFRSGKKTETTVKELIEELNDPGDVEEWAVARVPVWDLQRETVSQNIVLLYKDIMEERKDARSQEFWGSLMFDTGLSYRPVPKSLRERLRQIVHINDIDQLLEGVICACAIVQQLRSGNMDQDSEKFEQEMVQ
eukprot:115611-Hanusia_phi.AAC.1